MQMHVAVIANERHAAWLAEWSERVGDQDGLVLHPALLPDCLNATASLSSAWSGAEVGGAPCATLVLVNGDSVSWAKNLVSKISATAGPIGFVTRAVQPMRVLELLKRGGQDFIAWDCRREELLLRLRKLVAGAMAGRALPSCAQSPRHPKLASLIGNSAAFVAQIDNVPLFAGCDAGVLILGETGTGKDLFAQALHYLSRRAGQPMVAVNCGALPSELVEAELFGHARGAFTSAHDSRIGLVAQAQGGTLFLDEVDSLPALAQVKLLRFLQDHEYRPVGSARQLRADVRVIAASNADLAGLVQRGGFRSDLYYRLNVLSLSLPALRERGDDVLALARHFADCYAHRFDRPVFELDADVQARLAAYPWPGNVRELENAIERGVLLAPGKALRAQDLRLPDSGADATASESFQAAKARVVEQFERHAIENALARCDGNITQAALTVAKNRRAFWQLMRKHGIDSKRFCSDGRTPAARRN